MNWLQKNITNLKEVKLSSNRIMNALRVYYYLLEPKKSTIIFQYPLLGIPIFNNNILFRLNSIFFLYVLKSISKRKNLLFDISDLKYEQSIDLDINESVLDAIKEFEEKFFKLNARFVFASQSMRKYAEIKYNITQDKSDICKNGGTIIEDNFDGLDISFIDRSKLNFVYAGSLNKGRQIERMIDNFPHNNKCYLYIMGNGGEWLKSYINQGNIMYLGALKEENALYICSHCDVGLIPYDEKKKYYNIAYPTKLSFYITAGISFLSTPVDEVKYIKNMHDIGFIKNMNEWSSFFCEISKEIIQSEKVKIIGVQSQYVWDHLFRECTTYKNLAEMNVKLRT